MPCARPAPLQELKGLAVVLDATPAPFCLELAALAARREYLNLEKWLSDQFTAKGSAFMQSAVAFLDSKLRSEQPALQVSRRQGAWCRLGGGAEQRHPPASVLDAALCSWLAAHMHQVSVCTISPEHAACCAGPSRV